MATGTYPLPKNLHAARHATNGADPITLASIGAADAAHAITDAERAKLALVSGTNTGDQTSVTGNAGTATKLAVARAINGVAFDGTASITLPVTSDSSKVNTSTTVNGHALTGNVAIVSGDISDFTTAAQAAVGGSSGTLVPTSRTVNGHALTGNVAVVPADLPSLVASVQEVSGTYGNRPATTGPVIWMGADTPAAGGTTAGGTAAAVNGLDIWFKKA